MIKFVEAYSHELAHFPALPPQDVIEYINEVALSHSRYIFLHRQNKVLFGFCTYCKEDMQLSERPKENKRYNCPSCDSVCTVKHSGRSRKHLQDEAHVEWFAKSELDDKILVAVAMNVHRDFSSDDFREYTETYNAERIYILEMGNCRMLQLKWHWDSKNNDYYVTQNLNSVPQSFYSNKPHYTFKNSLKSAIKGTPFQYSTWEEYSDINIFKILQLYSQYPVVEYLTKLGVQDVVRRKLLGQRTYGVVNWNGKSVEKVMRLSKQDIKELLKLELKITAPFLKLYQQLKKKGEKIDLSLFYQAFHGRFSSPDSRYDDIQKLTQYTTLQRILNYSARQISLEGTRLRDYSVFSTWLDYIRECKKLQMDLENDRVLFPKNLEMAHQRNIQRIKWTADRLLTKKIKERANELSHYIFKNESFIIRPAISSEEVVREGNKLEHCVGGYTKDYAEGKTSIFVIRRTEAIGEPFYTLELRGQEIRQVYGYKNSQPTEELVDFLKIFKNEKLKAKKSKLAG